MAFAAVSTFRGIIPQGMVPLGFGCGALLCDGLSPRASLRLVETALDCGVTYFDTARMYGHGAAESVLGKLMPRHRGRIVLTSKVGILPPRRIVLKRALSRGIGFLHDLVPKSMAYVSKPDPWQARFHAFRPHELRRSLEISLKELKTDYLDILLLHECAPADAEEPYLPEFLAELKKRGIIREFGLASGIDDTLGILETRPWLTAVVQIPNNVWAPNIERLPPRPDGLTITHSCFTDRLRKLCRHLSLDESLATKWRSMTRVDPDDATALAQLLLAHSLRANPGGIVLFSSLMPEHIRSNMRFAAEGSIDEVQFAGLSALLSSEPRLLAGT